jgi:hypothetical protein
MMAVTVDQLLPRLLAGIGEQSLVALEQHLDVHGPSADLRRWAPQDLIALAESAGLRGHGGAAFPMARKMRAVASRRGRSIVVANGSECEPASKKDRVLLREAPHLALDGAAVAARAVDARDAIVVVSAEDERSVRSLGMALRDRAAAGLDTDPRFELFLLEPGYLAGQETALVSALNGGPAPPTFAPPLPFERGVRGRPTLVHNVETLAHLALIARHGAGWFRELGTELDPGSALVTMSGALAAPGVYEIEHGMPLSELLEAARLTNQVAGVRGRDRCPRRRRVSGRGDSSRRRMVRRGELGTVLAVRQRPGLNRGHDPSARYWKRLSQRVARPGEMVARHTSPRRLSAPRRRHSLHHQRASRVRTRAARPRSPWPVRPLRRSTGASHADPREA